MKKRVYGSHFSRAGKSRKALFRSLVRALVVYGKITTTKAKAKSIQALVDKLVNLAKVGSVACKRKVYAFLGNDSEVSRKIFEIVKTNFSGKTGGYTRVVKLPERRGDRSPSVRLEWSEEIVERNKMEGNKSKKKSGSKKRRQM